MIAYKVFEVKGSNFYPWLASNKKMFVPYQKNCIITRADDCGPFACFKTFRAAENFRLQNQKFSIYKVHIKKSRAGTLWRGDDRWFWLLPDGTILADEFEILERVK